MIPWKNEMGRLGWSNYKTRAPTFPSSTIPPTSDLHSSGRILVFPADTYCKTSVRWRSLPWRRVPKFWCLKSEIFEEGWGGGFSTWGFPTIVVPQNGRFVMENPVKMDDLGGTTIFGSTHVIFGVLWSHWGNPDVQPRWEKNHHGPWLLTFTIYCGFLFGRTEMIQMIHL